MVKYTQLGGVLFALSIPIFLLAKADFVDVQGHVYQQAITLLAERGIIHGYPDFTFRPNALLKRGELLKIVLEQNYENLPSKNCFPDVKETDWFSKYVCKARELGFVQGYPDGTFRPGSVVNFVEALKILQKAYRLPFQISSGSYWFEQSVRDASAMDIIPLTITSFNHTLARGQMADMLARLISRNEGWQQDYLGENKYYRHTFDTLANYLPPKYIVFQILPQQAPTVDIKANNSDGPITISKNSSAVLTWSTSGNPSSCEATGDWLGIKNNLSGVEQTLPLFGPRTFTYTLTCMNSLGLQADSVTVIVTGDMISSLTGCQYNNPSCGANERCVNNICLSNLAYDPNAPPNRNRALDLLVYIDTQSHPNGSFTGYPDLSRTDAERVLALADQLFYEKTGVHLVLRDIRFRSFADLVPFGMNDLQPLRNWADPLTSQEANPPEVIVIFSKLAISWQYGGFALTHGSEVPNASYCNEFDLITGGQKGVGLAVVDWHHRYGRCGYDGGTFPATNRISEIPTSGECRGNPQDRCVLRSDQAYYICESIRDYPYFNLDFFTATNIIHEIGHILDRELLGHYGSPICQVSSEGEAGEEAFLRDSQENFGMCPQTFENLPNYFKGCEN